MPRPYRLMYGLLYPAVLGSVFVSIFSPLSRLVEGEPMTGPEFELGKLLLTLGIVVHFIVDYTLGQEAREHGWFGFVVDCMILAGLSVAAASVHSLSVSAPDVRIICITLAIVYGIFLFYFAFIHKELSNPALVVGVEILGLLWFLIGSVWLPYVSFTVVGLFVSATLLLWTVSKALRPASQGTERTR